jgi:hypothetical protein
MYVMPEGRNTDAALHRDINNYVWAPMDTNNAHLQNQTGVRI